MMEKAVNPKRTPRAYSLLSMRTGKKVTPSASMQYNCVRASLHCPDRLINPVYPYRRRWVPNTHGNSCVCECP